MVCLPLDGLASLADLKSRVQELSPVVGLFKVGKGSFTRFGLDAVRAVEDYGAEVFLDLKYHDIPNTIRDAAKAAAEHGVYMFNVHASGGRAMMEAAVQGAAEGAAMKGYEGPKLIGVTVLTSIDRAVMHDTLRVKGDVDVQVYHLAQQASIAGLDGIVCSAADLSYINERGGIPDTFMKVTPGIKGPKTPAGADQKRVFTPGNAIQDGASILVIGRAITSHATAEQRLEAGYEILRDMTPYIKI